MTLDTRRRGVIVSSGAYFASNILATTRFYAEYSEQGLRRLRDFCSNMLGGAVAGSAVCALTVVFAARWIAGGADPEYARCLRLASVVVVIRVVASVIYQIYRAQERVLAYAVGRVGGRYITVALVIVLLLYYQGAAYEVILATLIAESLVMVFCLVDLTAGGTLGLPRISWPTIMTATAYGVPLALSHSASFVLDYGDRFLIARILGLNAVATYAVPYDLTQNLAAGIFGPVRLAVVPIIFSLWVKQGQESTSQFASQVLTYMIALAIPIGTLFLIMNKDVILLLASAKYGDSAVLTPYLFPGVLIGEMNFLIASGLAIEKRTTLLAVNVICAGALNVGLNLILLPRWGLTGAAVATTAAYLALTIATYVQAQPVLRLRVQFAPIARAMVATVIMVILVLGIAPGSSASVVDIVARGIAGAGAAAVCMSILDREIRRRTWLRLARVR
jgi:O-antigen/teichoic acid export membrane protein